MKRRNFTLTELLTVIAIIGILAGFLFPTINASRQRARATSCFNNQGQTMKIIQTAMDKADGLFHSGNAFVAPDGDVGDNEAWTSYLAEKNLLNNLEAFRCSELTNTTNGKTVTADSLKEAFGVFYTTANNNKLNFRGSKLLTTSDDTQIAPSALMIGACCAASDNFQSKALLAGEEDSFTNKITPAHGARANMFFLDGGARTLTKGELDSDSYYRPIQKDNDEGEAKLISAGSAWNGK